MRTSLHKAIIVVACLFAVAAVGLGTVRAEDTEKSNDAAQAVPADKPSDAGTVDCPHAENGCPHAEGGCPHAANGGCCEACKEKAAKAGGAATDPADCPCKRAKELQ